MGVHRNENLILKKYFFIYISMGVHRNENLILQKFFEWSYQWEYTAKKNM